MPDHFYTGPAGRYPALRDSAGVLVHDVAPGDVRDFTEPPDAHWLPADGNEDHALLASPDGAPQRKPRTPKRPAAANPDPAADADAPGPTTATAGTSGSEES